MQQQKHATMFTKCCACKRLQFNVTKDFHCINKNTPFFWQTWKITSFLSLRFFILEGVEEVKVCVLHVQGFTQHFIVNKTKR